MQDVCVSPSTNIKCVTKQTSYCGCAFAEIFQFNKMTVSNTVKISGQCVFNRLACPALCEDRRGCITRSIGLNVHSETHVVPTTQPRRALDPQIFHVALECADVEFDVDCVKKGSGKFLLASEPFIQVTAFCTNTPEAQPAPRVHSSLVASTAEMERTHP